MSKKHFVLLAEAIGRFYLYTNLEDVSHEVLLDKLIEHVSQACKEANINFSHQRFRDYVLDLVQEE